MKVITEETGTWQSGWLSSAQRLDSPNFGARPIHSVIELIVVHSISLPPGIYGGRQVQALFTNQLDWQAHPYFEKIQSLQVSSHFYIERDGKLWQFVSVDDRAWHAGQSQFGQQDNCNDFSVGIEMEGLEGEAFEPAQYLQLIRLCQALRQRYPIAYVAGHEHIAPGRKFDPGPGFDWGLVKKKLGWSVKCFPFVTF
jgi:N-acetyl-anhydromuramoyl-L-alanine amidase